MGIWTELGLDPARHGLVALVGGGGKTTTLWALAHEAALAGKTVAVTATTHMMPPPGLPLTDDPACLPELFRSHPVVVLGRWDAPHKITSPLPPHRLRSLADVALVEADGARTRPLKAPAGHEPVIPPNADAVVAVAGLDALGQPIEAVCHQIERVTALLGKNSSQTVTETDVARLLAHPQGGRKGVPAGAEFRCLLNKADTPGLREKGLAIQKLLAAEVIFAAVHTYSKEERGGACWF